jgi:hypothetical protein
MNKKLKKLKLKWKKPTINNYLKEANLELKVMIIGIDLDFHKKLKKLLLYLLIKEAPDLCVEVLLMLQTLKMKILELLLLMLDILKHIGPAPP